METEHEYNWQDDWKEADKMQHQIDKNHEFGFLVLFVLCFLAIIAYGIWLFFFQDMP